MNNDKSRSLLRDRNFALLWSSQSLSLLGSQITFVAIPITAVIVLGATPMESGILGALERIPFLVFGLGVGVLVDRIARRPVLIVADAIRALALAWIPLAFVAGLLTIWQLYAVALVVGTMTVFFDIAYQSYLPGLVGRDRLMEANSKLQMTESMAEVGGPGVAGTLIGLLSAPVVIVVDVISYLTSTVALLWMPADKPSRSSSESSVWVSLREGFAQVLQRPVLRWCIASTLMANLFFDALTAVFFLFLVREANIAPGGVGLIVAVGSAGALCGTFAVDRLTRALGVGPTLVLSTALPGVGTILLALVHGNSPGAIVLAAAANFVSLIGWPMFNVTVISFRQAFTPDHLLGRVNATMRTIAWSALALGALLGGALGSWLGLRETVIVAAGGLFVPMVILLISPLRRVRRLEEVEDAENVVQPT
ncbi:MFS transporter [Microbispora amethystogenes]|uniref:MFS transporter n=1 Tax=Microbispora amethystogenes TaxID=1427754 RepID=UPI0033D79C94